VAKIVEPEPIGQPVDTGPCIPDRPFSLPRTELPADLIGGGTVTEAEFADDGGTYSVEVRLGNGSHVEVRLDEHFNVLGQGADDDGGADNDGGNDD
jgi:hypothetical protein